jgi:type II secretory pathway component PulL
MDNALALGLAEIGGFQALNIYRSQFPAKKLWGKYKDQILKTGWIAAAVLVLMFVGQLIESYTLNRRIAQIDRQARSIYRAAFPEATKITDPFAEMAINLREAKKAAGINTAMEDQVRSIDVLNSISQQIPASVTVDINRLVIAADNTLISGQTGGYDSVDEVKNSLGRIPFFKKVTITSSNIDRSGKEVRFQIKAER